MLIGDQNTMIATFSHIFLLIASYIHREIPIPPFWRGDMSAWVTVQGISQLPIGDIERFSINFTLNLI
jgi:hypothetical protein